jgi:PilZ domain
MPSEQRRWAERVPLPAPLDARINEAVARLIDLSLIGARLLHADRFPIGTKVRLRFSTSGIDVDLTAKVVRTQMRSKEGKTFYESGLQFATSLADAPESIHKVMQTLVAVPEELAGMLGAAETASNAAAPKEDEIASDEIALEPPAASDEIAIEPPERSHEIELEPPAGSDEIAIADPAPAHRISDLFFRPAPFMRTDLDDEEEEEPPPYVSCEMTPDGWRVTPVRNALHPSEGFTMLRPADEADIDAYCRTFQVADPDTRQMIRLSFELVIAQKAR